MPDPMESGQLIYRAMEEEGGMPKLGLTATTLGVRNGKDILTDTGGMVHRPSFAPNQPNGVSCAPNLVSLPAFALPLAWGGLNKRTKLWCIDPSILGPELTSQDDIPPGKRPHISIGPTRPMTFDEFLQAVQATRRDWRIVDPAGA